MSYRVMEETFEKHYSGWKSGRQHGFYRSKVDETKRAFQKGEVSLSERPFSFRLRVILPGWEFLQPTLLLRQRNNL
jgi:hypothetical protein